MPTESFRISTVIAATPAQIYEAWMDSEQHAAMTGGEATVEGHVGGRFAAWGPYITGTTIELDPERRIVQRWRTNEFPADAPDSRLEVLLSAEAGGTRVSLVHSEVPEGQGDSYRRGWEEFYFQPMKRYFARNAETERPPASDTLPMAPPNGFSEPHPSLHAARPKEEREAAREANRAGARTSNGVEKRKGDKRAAKKRATTAAAGRGRKSARTAKAPRRPAKPAARKAPSKPARSAGRPAAAAKKKRAAAKTKPAKRPAPRPKTAAKKSASAAAKARRSRKR